MENPAMGNVSIGLRWSRVRTGSCLLSKMGFVVFFFLLFYFFLLFLLPFNYFNATESEMQLLSDPVQQVQRGLQRPAVLGEAAK